MDDLEVGLDYQHPSRPPNKKMKKRKQLDALLKFRPSSTSKNSRNHSRAFNDTLLTSEDELFLPHQSTGPKKSYSSTYRRWCSYTRHILSFCLVCIFMIVCVGLAYANIELKNEVQNLSTRISSVEKRLSTSEIARVLSNIEQIQTRLTLVERSNVSYLYDRLHRMAKDRDPAHPGSTEMSMNDDDISSRLETIEQKSKDFSEVASELEKLSRDAEQQATDVINTHPDANQFSKNLLILNASLSAYNHRWEQELNLIRTDMQQMSNQTIQIHELNHRFELLHNLIHNSSNRTSTIIIDLQATLDELRTRIDACKCFKGTVEGKKMEPADHTNHTQTVDELLEDRG